MVRIECVETHVVKLRPPEAYLGARPDGDHGDDYYLRPPWRSLYSDRFETLLVKLTADDGTYGWGEALAPVAPEVPQAIVDRLLAPALIGQDPRRVRPLWARLTGLMRERGHLVGHQADALAAVDTSLWDLAGKAYGMPVHALLGGAFRTEVPTYVSGLPRPTDSERVELAADWVRQGVRAIKLHLGHGVDADLATYDAVAATHPDLRVAVDAHWAYDTADALRLGRALDERRAWFLEAPLVPEDVDGHRELAAAIATPVAVGEALRNRYEFRAWLAARAVDLCQPDVARTGITEAMAIVEVAAAHHVPVAPHHSVGLGVAVAAGLHVAAAIDAMPAFEFQPGTMRVASRILTVPLAGGPVSFPLPDSPGLGVDVDHSLLEDL
ncbi:mandelate racemase/muconate lactonizing enzyme family protein [Micromonospora sp. DR5-3]|uniref:mandelate racemase/muconate lactonizing enzyme family protein n=1 Tax=unclassified Micromonospora TaxID=2617518 RepID=UPI0011D76010|nr:MULTISPECIES: mandelate racemase/muconate lactonizing enzyme family protein [unclassified Micromonospora]MCW3814418.1 mandelate racemase/muconate lactonizing enzyme family protein [Micromonospora sp. DR5-3]TYC19701.1 mandelate racemase/muconate lactonizing enzyme family protein [Micromonospora sp. MP36]